MSDRTNFGQIKETIDIPNLIDIQTSSAYNLYQFNTNPEEREKKGIEEVLREIFPIINNDQSCTISYNYYTLGKAKKKYY